MKEKKTLFYKNYFLKYEIIWKNIKKINLRICDEGKIKVSAPFFVKINQIEYFLYQNIDFIIKNSDKRKNSNFLNIDSNIVSLFGVRLKIDKIFSSKNSIKIENDTMYIYYKKNEDVKKLVKKVLKKCAIIYFKKRLDFFSEKMDINYNGFEVKWLKTKWGHCDSNKKIVLNYKLISYTKEIIDYVIVHELSHIIYMNHSEDFWNLVEDYCPNWKIFQKQLKI